MKISKPLSLLLASSMLLSLLVGCQSKTEETTKGTTTSAQTSTEEQSQGKRTDIVIGSTVDVANPDPHNQIDTASARVVRLMYNSLVRTEFDGTITPALCEKYEVVSDTEYKFYIREGVTFHNGYKLTAEDVKFSLERAIASPIVNNTVGAISEVIIDGPMEVTVKTELPNAPLLGNLSDTKASIVSKQYVEELEAQGKTLSEAPNGTGPMKFESWRPNDNFVVVRNDDYYVETPVATSVEIRVIPEPSSLTIALETGEIDMIESVPAIDIGKITENVDLKNVTQPSTSITFVSYNIAKAPFDNVKVRQALSCATDKEAIIDVICEGYAIQSNNVFPSTMPGFDASLNPFPYDVERAKALLVEAGYPEGFSTKIATSGDERNRIAQLLQSNYAEIGVNIDIELLEWGAYLEHISGTNHDMYIVGWSTGYEPDTSAYPLFHSVNVGSKGNRSWYVNPVADELIDKGRSTIAWSEREPIYKELQSVLMNDAVWIPLFSKNTVIGMNKNLEGVDISPTDAHIYYNAYVVE